MVYMILILYVVLQILVIGLANIAVMLIIFFIAERVERYYYLWKDKRFRRKCEKDYEITLQRKRRIELHRKEREKYPLFYWKENI